MQIKEVFLSDWGTIDYKEAWDKQAQLFEGIVNTKISNREHNTLEPTHNHLILCEHPHVYTLGKTGKKENLLLNEAALNEKKATYFEINRGGDITYHGPGQLVVYPILDLDNFFTDIHKYMRFLEECVIQTNAHFGVASGRVSGLTGVWLGDNDANYRKICAMGVKTSRWVTMHGLALNVNTDLDYFNNIIPCGISDKAVTSLKQETGRNIDMTLVKKIFTEKFQEIFECSITAV
jgi:lipoyl(octanoyl) transferase